MATTTNFAVENPTVWGYRNSWGGPLNVALDKITELPALALPIGTIQMHTAAAAPFLSEVPQEPPMNIPLTEDFSVENC